MIAIFSFSDKGEILADRIKGELNTTSYRSGKTDFVIKDFIRENWREFSAIIFICATGIAVRMINGAMISKSIDPAVVVMDDTGRHVISLLSGHLGGANDLAYEIAELIGADPVITTSTDNHYIEGVDDFSRRQGYVLTDARKILPISKLMLAGKTIGFYSKYKPMPSYKLLKRVDSFKDKSFHGMIVVSPEPEEKLDIPYIWLYPKVINLGIGCRKGVPKERIIRAIESLLADLSLSIHSIKAIGSAEAKRNEEGIIETAKHYKCPFKIFSNEEIQAVEDKFEKSDFVKKSIGVYNVSAPAAYLLGGRMLTEKFVADDITLSVTLED